MNPAAILTFALTAVVALFLGYVFIKIIAELVELIRSRRKSRPAPPARRAEAQKAPDFTPTSMMLHEISTDVLPSAAEKRTKIDMLVANKNEIPISIVDIEIFVLPSKETELKDARREDRCDILHVATFKDTKSHCHFLDKMKMFPFMFAPFESRFFRLYLGLPEAHRQAQARYLFLGGWVSEDTGKRREFYWQLDRR